MPRYVEVTSREQRRLDGTTWHTAGPRRSGIVQKVQVVFSRLRERQSYMRVRQLPRKTDQRQEGQKFREEEVGRHFGERLFSFTLAFGRTTFFLFYPPSFEATIFPLSLFLNLSLFPLPLLFLHLLPLPFFSSDLFPPSGMGVSAGASSSTPFDRMDL